MKALPVKFEKLVGKCVFSKFATLSFKLLKAHAAAHLVRPTHGATATVGGLRTRQIAMVGESASVRLSQKCGAEFEPPRSHNTARSVSLGSVYNLNTIKETYY